jgi:DKNYY family
MGDDYSSYAKDNQRGYFEGIGFEVHDVGSLEILEGWFLKDKFQVYHGQKAILGSDPKSFRLLNEHYAQDTAHVYFYNFPNEGGVTLIPCISSSFTLLEYPYSKDASSVYYVNVKMHDVDAQTFSVLGNRFSKDKQNVFFQGKKIVDAEALTFSVLPQDESSLDELYYAKDKMCIFLEEKKIKNADILTFKVLGLDYAVDNKNVYYKTTIVKGANPNNFKIYEHSYGDEDAEDSKNKYSKGIKVGRQ